MMVIRTLNFMDLGLEVIFKKLLLEKLPKSLVKSLFRLILMQIHLFVFGIDQTEGPCTRLAHGPALNIVDKNHLINIFIFTKYARNL